MLLPFAAIRSAAVNLAGLSSDHIRTLQEGAWWTAMFRRSLL